MRMFMVEVLARVAAMIFKLVLTIPETPEEAMGVRLGWVVGHLRHIRTCPKCHEAAMRYAALSDETMGFLKDIARDAVALLDDAARRAP